MSKTNRPILLANGLGLTFPNGNGGLRALADITFSIQEQEFLCVVGPSGSGKTTLLKLLAGLVAPTAGEVIFEGEQITKPRRRIGFVFQEANLMPWRNVQDNIALPLELEGLPEENMQLRTEELIQLVGLADFEQSYPRDLSGGMAQRVAIARALIHQPDLLLLDEPFGSLDELTRERMGTELNRIWRARRVTVIMVTHSISEAVFLSDRIIAIGLRPGRIRLDINNTLPRPRNLGMKHTHEFGILADQIRKAIAE